MKINTIVEVICAAHLSYLVNSPKEFSSCGGLMFVAPVGHLKTVITKTLDLWQPQALVLSDITIRQLVEMREQISSGKIHTLGFMELPKLYSRNADVSSNVEGAIQQMADEGWRAANWENQNMTLRDAKCLIVGAMPPSFYARKWGGWNAGGWSRRFIWCHFQLADTEIIMESIDRWQPLDLGRMVYSVPASASIPFTVTQDESRMIRNVLRRTKAGYEAVPFQLLKKIFAVIKWRYSEMGTTAAKKKALEILFDFAQCLQGVADLQIDLPLLESSEGEEVESPKRARRA
jgi:hypothetical protein